MRSLNPGWCSGLARRLIFVAIITGCGFPAVSAAVGTASTENLRTIRLGRQVLMVPRRYMDEGWLAWQERARPGMPALDDGSREMLLTIDAAEAERIIPGFHPQDGKIKEDLQLRLVDLTDEERQRYLDPNNFSEIWQATGSYAGSIVEPDPERGVFRVYRKIEHPQSWEILRVSPGTGSIPADIFSFWVGHCLKTQSPLTANASCRSYAVVGSIGVHFSTSEQNIYMADEIRRHLTQMITQWQDAARRKQP